jgi:hypothetical protein
MIFNLAPFSTGADVLGASSILAFFSTSRVVIILSFEISSLFYFRLVEKSLHEVRVWQ